MRTLLLAILCSTTALAGGAGPRPEFPLKVGQFWEVQWHFTSELPTVQRVGLEWEFPKTRTVEKVRSFKTEGGALTAFLPVRFLIATQDGQVNRFCIAPFSALDEGYALRGTSDELGTLVPQRHVNHNPNDGDLYDAALKAGHGTCTLKRLQ